MAKYTIYYSNKDEVKKVKKNFDDIDTQHSIKNCIYIHEGRDTKIVIVKEK